MGLFWSCWMGQPNEQKTTLAFYNIKVLES
jgi:hypothetical protein